MPVVCCCAAAGVLATVRATSGANTPSQIILVIFIVHFLSLTELSGSLTIASPLIAVLNPAILDREVAAVEPSQLAQPRDKSGNPLALNQRRGTQEADGWQPAQLLCARGKWPRRRAADKRGEF